MHGLYLLWWVQERHVSPAAVAMILAAGDLAVTLFEIPTGWLADRFGYRRSLIAGSAVQVAGMLCCWLGRGIPGLLAASLLVAFGDGFRSGADQALLYQSCARLGRERDFQAIEARAHAVQLAALVVLVLAGGAIVENWGFHAGWLAETLVSAAGLAIAFAMVEPPNRISEGGHGEAAIAAVGSSVRLYLPALLVLIAPAALLSGAAAAASFWAQTGGSSEPRELTLIVAVMALAEAAGSFIAARLQSAGARTQVLLAAVGGVVFAAALVNPAALPATAVALALFEGLAHPLRAAAIQQLAGDRVRAQAASIASACDKACGTIALTLAGVRGR
jgi:predicted MFS family arabinose efflux permease